MHTYTYKYIYIKYIYIYMHMYLFIFSTDYSSVVDVLHLSHSRGHSPFGGGDV